MFLFVKRHSSIAGFTLIELIIAIAIMGIVTAISTLSFTSWQKKNNIESQVRDLFAVLMEARNNSFMQKKQYRVTFQPKSYVMSCYSSDNDLNGKTVATKNLAFQLTKSGTTSSVADIFVSFDTAGFTTNKYTLIVNPLDVSASLNCLVISETRVNMGKINGSVCEFK